MKKAFHILAAMLTSSFAFAQEEEAAAPATTWGGSADAYYKYDFSKQMNGLTSFTNSQNSFELGMASVQAGHTFGKAAVFVDLGFEDLSHFSHAFKKKFGYSPKSLPNTEKPT